MLLLRLLRLCRLERPTLVPLALALALALGSAPRNLEAGVHDFFEQFVHFTMNAFVLFDGEKAAAL